MRSSSKLLGSLLLAASALPLRAGQLDSLSWLTGCWASPRNDPGSGEYWLPLAGGTMLGLGRTVRNGTTIEYEFLRLHEDSEGRAVYTATPSRQKETSFVATHVGDGTATFENPAHDFPQRIIYTRVGKERMVVRIEGERPGKHRSVEFHFSRTACPS